MSPHPRKPLLSALRIAALGAGVGVLFLFHGPLAHLGAADTGATSFLGMQGFAANLSAALVVLLALGLAIPRKALLRPEVPISLLVLDLLAIGVTAAMAPAGPEGLRASGGVPSAFLAAYVVAVLVATAGRRLAYGALGALAGAMILMLGSADGRVETTATVAAEVSTQGDLDPLARTARDADHRVRAASQQPASQRAMWLRLLLLGLATLECSVVMGWVDEEIRRRRTAQSIERELHARERTAGEMASFVAAANSVSTLDDLANALFKHLRQHVSTRARGLVLDNGTHPLALWEEDGPLDEGSETDRRKRLVTALKDIGAPANADAVEVRVRTGVGRDRQRRRALATCVSVPVHSGGRVAGVLFVADPERGVVEADRVVALAEAARQTGAALQRIERLREEQTRRTALLLAHMREGVALLGPHGEVMMCNPAAREMLRALRQPEEGPVEIGEVTSEDLARTPSGTVRRLNATAVGADGKEVKLSVAAMGVVDGGTRLGTLLTLTDVTEEEFARRRLMQAEKLSVVGQTLAGVAHELNNPLAAIVGYAELLLDVSGEIPRETALVLSKIREQATRTSRIVKNLLGVARRRGPEARRVGLNEVVEGVKELFAYDARLGGVELETDLDPDLPLVVADRHAIQQVLVNLVRNAVQAVTGRAHGAGGRVVFTTRNLPDGVSVSVRDDGPGVPPEIRGRIFEPFFTTKGGEEGTGLGLALSRGIAREHGGDLVLESAPGGAPGACFALRIPHAHKSPLPVEPDDQGPIPSGVPAHVLVVDDEEPVREALAAQLAGLGAQVDGAGTPLEAARLLDGSAAYDAILLDLRLPGQSGLDLHRTLRVRNPRLASKVVFMTGDLVNDELLRAVHETGNTLLEKPFSPDELRKALAIALAAT